MALVRNFIKFLIFPFIFGFGVFYFVLSKKTIPISYFSFRYLFVLTDGKVNDFHSWLIGLVSKPKEVKAKGILGDLSESDVNEIVDSIRKNGFHSFDVQLNEEIFGSMVNFAKTEPSNCVDMSKKGVNYLKDEVVFDPSNIRGPRYQFKKNRVAKNTEVRKILFDPTFRTIAGKYLRCKPILDIVTMWWSVPFSNKGTSQAAQKYHFDMDRFKFLKFFFYLTDVHEDNGPHCYIRHSHKSIPSQIRKDRRIDDNELTNYFKEEDILELTGKKGTILAVDTRGLHKGKPLVKDSRLLFQVQFSNSLFGASYEVVSIEDLTEIETKTITEHKRTYQLFR
jgi:hypothetical protein